MRWLESLVWPGPSEATRRERLRAAARVAAADPPHLVSGDLVRVLPELASQAPKEATLVVFHGAVLAYLDSAARDAFVRVVTGCRGIGSPTRGGVSFPTRKMPDRGYRPTSRWGWTVGWWAIPVSTVNR